MAKKTIEIKCTGSTEFSLGELNELQGDLKERKPEAMKKLRKSILKHGFIAPFFAWENPDTARIELLDGHSRLHVLREMKEEGFVMPAFPVDFIDASSLDDAKAKLLAISSQYGKFTEKGVSDFIASFDDLDDDMFDTLDIPFLDIGTTDVLEPDEEGKVVDVNSHTRTLKDYSGDEVEDKTSPDFREKCPHCGEAL